MDVPNIVAKAGHDGNASLALSLNCYGYDDALNEGPRLRMNVSALANSRVGITYGVNFNAQARWLYPSDLNWGYTTVTSNGGDLSDAMWAAQMPNPDSFGAPFCFQFYRGQGSGEYSWVNVSTNGFICLDSLRAGQWSACSTPVALPNNMSAPPAMIAALWTHMYMDSRSSITWGTYSFDGSPPIFVVLWNNMVHYGDDVRLTFEIQLWNAYNYAGGFSNEFSQSNIYLVYGSVSNINTKFGWGIQDQYGFSGLGYVYSGTSLGGLSNSANEIYQNSNYLVFLKSFKVAFTDLTDSNANIQPDPDYYFNGANHAGYNLEGYNIPLNYDYGFDATGMYLNSLSGAITVATAFTAPIGGWGGALVLLAGGLGLFLQGATVCNDYANSIRLEQQNQLAGVSISLGYNSTYSCIATANTCSYVVDAGINFPIFWNLNDANPYQNHELFVEAVMQYSVFDRTSGTLSDGSSLVVCEAVQMNPDNNFTPETPFGIDGGATYSWLWLGDYNTSRYYETNVPDSSFTTETIVQSMLPNNQLDSYVGLINPSGHTVYQDSYKYSHDITLNAPNAVGMWLVNVTSYGTSCGFFNLTVNFYAPGGGCPYVSTWNGSQYLLDNNVLPASEFAPGKDVTDSYVVQQPLIQEKDGTGSLLLTEFENEHDFIDQVQLLAVDHTSNVNVGVTPEGQILTYMHPQCPVSAITNDGQDVKQLLSGSGGYYQSYNGSYVTLSFAGRDISEGAKLIIRSDNRPIKDPIFIQVPSRKDDWNTVETVIPRVNWSTDIVDMSPFLKDENGNVHIRLYFTAELKVGFAGLDASPQAYLRIHPAQLASALSSADGTVKAKLLYADQSYANLIPGESINMTFVLPKQIAWERTYIIVVTGHYYTIANG